MFNIISGAESKLDTYYGHEFQILELPNERSHCESDVDTSCKSGNFEVTEKSQQFILIKANLEIVSGVAEVYVPSATTPSQVIAECQERAEKRVAASPENSAEADSALDELMACVETGMSQPILAVNDEMLFHSSIREYIAIHMENFTCVDDNLGTTPDVDTRDWTSDKDGKTRTVHAKLDRPASRIHVIEDFASADECLAMEDAATPKLHQASVADGKGGVQFSEHRKAMQAAITPNWDEEENGDLVAGLSQRVYDYTNHVLGLNVTHFGQEPLMSIQYFGRGYNDTTPDRYAPHCDGSCDGKPHRSGSRMATMVIYCTIPERGGHTNFQNAGVHVKPSAGNAIFFSYIDPETKKLDNALTQHSGCPVYEGEKKIITQWVRYGVDQETDWTDFNTLGILNSEAGE